MIKFTAINILLNTIDDLTIKVLAILAIIVIIVLVGILVIRQVNKLWLRQAQVDRDVLQRKTDYKKLDAWAEAGRRVEYFIDDAPDAPPGKNDDDSDDHTDGTAKA